MANAQSADPSISRPARQELFARTKNTAYYYLNANSRYGEYGNYYSLSRKDATTELKRILDIIVAHWDKEKCEESDKDEHLWKYLNRWFDGETKKVVCKMRDASRHYSAYIAAIQKAGLDLQSSDEDDLLTIIRSARRPPKDAWSLLQKLKQYTSLDPSKPLKRGSTRRLLTEISKHLQVGPEAARYLLAMDIHHLDLWDSSDKELIDFFTGHCLYPAWMVKKLRAHLNGKEKDVIDCFTALHGKYLFPFEVKLRIVEESALENHKNRYIIQTTATPFEQSVEYYMGQLDGKSEIPIATAAQYIAKQTNIRPTDAKLIAGIMSFDSSHSQDDAYRCAVVKKLFPGNKNPLRLVKRLKVYNMEAIIPVFEDFKKLYAERRVDRNGNVRDVISAFDSDTSPEPLITVRSVNRIVIEDTAKNDGVTLYYAKWHELLKANGYTLRDGTKELCRVILVLDKNRRYPELLVARLRKVFGVQNANED